MNELNSSVSDGDPVCVLGMHRSGTSCLAGSLQNAGLYLGEVVLKAPHNLKGNRENLEIRALNDDVLAHSDATWRSPPKKVEWTESHERRRDSIFSKYDRVPKRWAFKDPRTLLTLPFWLDAGRSFLFIGTFRHPVAVARSLQARNGSIGLKEGINLWLQYNSRLLDIVRQYDSPLIDFDSHDDTYLEQLSSAFIGFGLDAVSLSEARKFFDTSLRHQRADTRPGETDLPIEVSDVLQELKQLRGKSALRLPGRFR